ncbi:MAG: hypothetical protein E6R08_01055 [Nevskiaceae bacterium]|nr:MAG: hypothetical protein E6R08_01055 [Nevskiaceae bacterium]
MQNMSFMLTKEAVCDRSKSVTRRVGWSKLKPGQVLRAVEKCMGLKRGEKVVQLQTIRIVSVRPERLSAMTEDVEYGLAECAKEGFGDHPTLSDPAAFVAFFCKSHKRCSPQTTVQRIEFEYVD